MDLTMTAMCNAITNNGVPERTQFHAGLGGAQEQALPHLIWV
jgi:hypothetical protein